MSCFSAFSLFRWVSEAYCSILFGTISINFIYYIFWTVATIYIHVSYGLFIHVYKCTYYTIWNKICTCTWNLRLIFSDIKCTRVFILFRTCTLSRLEGRGSLSTFNNHIPSKKKGGGVSACWTTTDRFQADITCSYSYEGSCRQLGSWTAGSCTFYSELVQSVEAQHRATFLHEKTPKQIK